MRVKFENEILLKNNSNCKQRINYLNLVINVQTTYTQCKKSNLFHYKNHPFLVLICSISSRRVICPRIARNWYHTPCDTDQSDICSADVDCRKQIAETTNELASTAEETSNRPAGNRHSRAYDLAAWVVVDSEWLVAILFRSPGSRVENGKCGRKRSSVRPAGCIRRCELHLDVPQ